MDSITLCLSMLWQFNLFLILQAHIFYFSTDAPGTVQLNNASTAPTGGPSTIRLQLGIFSIFPATGSILPGASAQITVDMFSEVSTICEEVRYH